MEVRSAFTRAYQALPADQARAFTLLGQLPPGEVTAPQLAPRLGTTNEHAGQLLDALVSSGLLEPSASPGSYRMHDLLRLYAKELSTEADRAQAHQP